VLAAWASNGAALVTSTDGGRSFGSLLLPPGTTAVRSVAIEGGRVWVASLDQSGRARLQWVQLGSDVWHAVTPPSAHPAALVTVVALGADRVLYLLDGYGFRCSVDAGATWQAACPAA